MIPGCLTDFLFALDVNLLPDFFRCDDGGLNQEVFGNILGEPGCLKLLEVEDAGRGGLQYPKEEMPLGPMLWVIYAYSKMALHTQAQCNDLSMKAALALCPHPCL